MSREETTRAIERHEESETARMAADRRREMNAPPPAINGVTAARALSDAAKREVIGRAEHGVDPGFSALNTIMTELAIAAEDNDWVKQWMVETAAKLDKRRKVRGWQMPGMRR